MTQRSVTHATFTLERVYDATPARVFRAFEDPAAKRRWFAEGEGWQIDAFDTDFRVGGYERSRFRFKGGAPITNDTTYQDIVPNERIIIAYSMTIGENRISSSLATMEFKKEGKGARLVFTEQGAFLDGHDNVAQREGGWKELLDALGRELNRQQAA
ncbi:MAG TPA: SRPBCC family protein [Dongiaceae bacterium]|nr:SRPBCC family protein [Dongiaceae bacterium]